MLVLYDEALQVFAQRITQEDRDRGWAKMREVGLVRPLDGFLSPEQKAFYAATGLYPSRAESRRGCRSIIEQGAVLTQSQYEQRNEAHHDRRFLRGVRGSLAHWLNSLRKLRNCKYTPQQEAAIRGASSLLGLDQAKTYRTLIEPGTRHKLGEVIYRSPALPEVQVIVQCMRGDGYCAEWFIRAHHLYGLPHVAGWACDAECPENGINPAI